MAYNGGHGLVGIKQKIQSYGDQLRAWGFSKANRTVKISNSSKKDWKI